MKEEKNEEINNDKNERFKNGTFYSKIYYSSYKNVNGEENEEKYQSQNMKQIKDGHDISEMKEIYKNSDGLEKTVYKRGLDRKTIKYIKEKNIKSGKYNQSKILKGIEENEIKDFNKEYNDFSKKSGFKNNIHNLEVFQPFIYDKKQSSDGNSHFLNHKLLL